MSNTVWINALAELQQQGEPCVLVTIIEERGSTPRNAGSKMVVSRERLYDTIGGGHLEYKAQKIAREMLENRVRETRLERFSLGASLGQCCGGATVLLFEPMGQPQAHIAVFGAGHVGRALVPLLASLPCKVRWIDSRESEFPAQIPAGVEKVVNDEVVDEVENMPAGSYFIVMTHNHQLDLELTAAILSRGDFTYYGLIGSEEQARQVRTPPARPRLPAGNRATHALPNGYRRSEGQAAGGDRGVHRRRGDRHLQRAFR